MDPRACITAIKLVMIIKMSMCHRGIRPPAIYPGLVADVRAELPSGCLLAPVETRFGAQLFWLSRVARGTLLGHAAGV